MLPSKSWVGWKITLRSIILGFWTCHIAATLHVYNIKYVRHINVSSMLHLMGSSKDATNSSLCIQGALAK